MINQLTAPKPPQAGTADKSGLKKKKKDEN